MSGTGSSPQRETSIPENSPLNGGEADNIAAATAAASGPESKSPTDLKKVSHGHKRFV